MFGPLDPDRATTREGRTFFFHFVHLSFSGILVPDVLDILKEKPDLLTNFEGVGLALATL